MKDKLSKYYIVGIITFAVDAFVAWYAYSAIQNNRVPSHVSVGDEYITIDYNTDLNSVFLIILAILMLVITTIIFLKTISVLRDFDGI